MSDAIVATNSHCHVQRTALALRACDSAIGDCNLANANGEFENGPYPQEWRDVCLEVLKAFRSHLSAVNANDASWEDVRDVMMEREDEYTVSPHRRLKSRIRSKAFRRQHLEAWDTGSQMTDDFFKYVDKFVRRLEIEGPEKIRSKIVYFKNSKPLKHLKEIYQQNRGNHTFASKILEKLPYSLQTLALSQSVFICMDYVYEGIGRGVLYYNQNIHNRYSTYPDHLYFYEFFVIPVRVNIYDETTSVLIENEYFIQLIRPEFKGIPDAGLSGGNLTVSISLENRAHIRRVSVKLRGLTSPTSKGFYSIDRFISDREHEAKFSILDKLPIDKWNLLDYLVKPDPVIIIKDKDEISFHSVDNLDSICRNVINKRYMGYSI